MDRLYKSHNFTGLSVPPGSEKKYPSIITLTEELVDMLVIAILTPQFLPHAYLKSKHIALSFEVISWTYAIGL